MTFEDRLKDTYTYDLSDGQICKEGQSCGWLCANGYIYVTTKGGRKVLAHRLAWLLTYGDWPVGDIDHINHDRSDNRLENLRELTRSQNLFNRKNPFSGISWDKSRNKLAASAGRGVNLGRFHCIGKAYQAKVTSIKGRMTHEV